MIGTKINKPITDYEAYAELASWCMSNGAIIVDKGDYYEVCENVPTEPTKEEKLAALDSQYEADKKELGNYYMDAMIHGDTGLMAELAEEMTALDEQYATDYEALKGGE